MSGLDIAGALAEGLKVYGGLKLAEQEKAEQQRLRREERLEALRQAVALRNAQMDPTTRIVTKGTADNKKPREMAETGYDELSVDDSGGITRGRTVVSETPNQWAPVKETVKDLTGLRVRTRTERDLAGRERSITEEDKLPSKVHQENRYNADGSMRQVNVDEYGNEMGQVGFRGAAASAARSGRSEADRIEAERRAEILRRQREEIKLNNQRYQTAEQRAYAVRETFALERNATKRAAMAASLGVPDDPEAVYKTALDRELKRVNWNPEITSELPSEAASEPAMSVSAGVNIGAVPVSQKPPKQEEPKGKPDPKADAESLKQALASGGIDEPTARKIWQKAHPNVPFPKVR